MSGPQDAPDDEGGAGWYDRSIYNGCGRCGAMVHDVDRDRHRRWHSTLSRALGEGSPRI